MAIPYSTVSRVASLKITEDKAPKVSAAKRHAALRSVLQVESLRTMAFFSRRVAFIGKGFRQYASYISFHFILYSVLYSSCLQETSVLFTCDVLRIFLP